LDDAADDPFPARYCCCCCCCCCAAAAPRRSGEGKGLTAPWMLRPRKPAEGEAATEEGRDEWAEAKLVESDALPTEDSVCVAPIPINPPPPPPPPPLPLPCRDAERLDPALRLRPCRCWDCDSCDCCCCC
jgi:hypothetical protein